ncbi:MAG TPA: hypothetical protein VIY48_09705 [Candidatus Paceibacterota bacterium]
MFYNSPQVIGVLSYLDSLVEAAHNQGRNKAVIDVENVSEHKEVVRHYDGAGILWHMYEIVNLP